MIIIFMSLLLLSKISRLIGYSGAPSEASALGYTIRRARKDDISRINQCNRENLPENYNYNFYLSHLDRWPNLSFIALSENDETMGYAIGRLEMMPLEKTQLGRFSLKPVYLGHVASLAVNKKFRGLGVAQSLMRELHHNFANKHEVDKSILYCRVSLLN